MKKEIEVDLELDLVDDEELIEELKERGYYNDEELIEELDERGYFVKPKEKFRYDELKRFLCDEFDLSYHIDKKILLDILKEKL